MTIEQPPITLDDDLQGKLSKWEWMHNLGANWKLWEHDCYADLETLCNTVQQQRGLLNEYRVALRELVATNDPVCIGDYYLCECCGGEGPRVALIAHAPECALIAARHALEANE